MFDGDMLKLVGGIKPSRSRADQEMDGDFLEDESPQAALTGGAGCLH